MTHMQGRLWGDSVDDDAMIDRWFATHRSITGKRHTSEHKGAVKHVVGVALRVGEATAASLALDASRDVLVALVALTAVQAVASAALMLAASTGVLVLVNAVLHAFFESVESR